MKASTKRRWIYVVSIALVVCCILIFISPKPTTARIALAIAPADANNDVAEVQMTVPGECLLHCIYLRGNKNVPAEGKLMTLIINGERIDIANYAQLQPGPGEQIAGFENKAFPVDIKKLSKAQNLVITYENLHPAVQRNDLELVVEIVGEDEIVKKWNSFIKLQRRHLPATAPAAAAEAPAASGSGSVPAEKKAPAVKPAP